VIDEEDFMTEITNAEFKSIFPKDNRYFETENGILYCGEAIKTMSKLPN